MEKLRNFISDHKSNLLTLSLVVLLFAVIDPAHAGSDGKEFNTVYDMLTGWAQGTLGRIICIAIVLVGIAASVKNGTLMPIVIGIGAAVTLYNAPSIVDGILSATIDTNVAVEELKSVANGLIK